MKTRTHLDQCKRQTEHITEETKQNYKWNWKNRREQSNGTCGTEEKHIRQFLNKGWKIDFFWNEFIK